jgi:RNA polymerase sigma-70 factor (ECF subfamily)
MDDPRLDSRVVQRLHRQANADRWDVPVARFAAALGASVARAFSGDVPDRRQVDRYLDSLHLEDLALACACADGHEGAWEHFVREHRPLLYRAADAIDSTGGARELADSLYAELFGLKERDGERQSLFRYFHGRSSLGTWLRALLAQRHVDRIRQTRRLDPLPPDETPEAVPAPVTSIDPERARFVAAMHRAVGAALARLVPRDRLRLACYYAQNLTLAEIGRAIGEHEATVSRHLTRTRRSIRQTVEQSLRQAEHMSDAEIAECFSSVSSDAGPLDLAELFGPQPLRLRSGQVVRKNTGNDRSTDEGPADAGHYRGRGEQ